MRGYTRKTTPKVQSGRVHKKNNWAEAGNYYNTPQPFPAIYRKRPGRGFRHVLRQEDIETFVTLLPDWTELSRGLDAIVLAPGDSMSNDNTSFSASFCTNSAITTMPSSPGRGLGRIVASRMPRPTRRGMKRSSGIATWKGFLCFSRRLTARL